MPRRSCVALCLYHCTPAFVHTIAACPSLPLFACIACKPSSVARPLRSHASHGSLGHRGTPPKTLLLKGFGGILETLTGLHQGTLGPYHFRTTHMGLGISFAYQDPLLHCLSKRRSTQKSSQEKTTSKQTCHTLDLSAGRGTLLQKFPTSATPGPASHHPGTPPQGCTRVAFMRHLVA